MIKKLLLVVMLGCGSKPPPAPVEPPVTTAPLELTFQTFAEAEGGQRPVASGDTLHTGDRIALSVTVTRPAFIYVVQRFPDGKAGVLFPRPSEDRAISGTQRIPGTGWFELDQVVGEEHVFVIASTGPLAQADAAVMQTIEDVRAKGQLGGAAQVSAIAGSAAPKIDEGTGTKAEIIATRGLTRVEADRSIHATADDRGVAVFRFSFKHDPK